MMRTEQEIEDQINEAVENDGKWPGMTYESGVASALRWVTGEDDLAPMNDEEEEG